jgi:hypothetical protein
MATGISDIASLNSLFESIYEDAMFIARESNIMTNLVKHYSAKGWMVRVFSRYPEITAKAKAEGVDFTDPTVWSRTEGVNLTPAMIMAQAILTDERIDTDPEDARHTAAQELGDAIATKIDRDLVSDFGAFTRDKGPGAGESATVGKFAAAISVLRNSKTPNPIRIVLHPFHWFDVWSELGQPAATKAFLGDLANQALKDFFVWDWLNCAWFSSANIGVDANADAVSAVFNPQAIAFDSRKRPEREVERDASRLAYEYNISAGYAHGVIRDEFGVKYTADATEPA